ncbi:uncharacterized protein [Physcomitrium patens]|uniref:Uncharacterized protein n=1 Tax=Physcomitrium patens TaxID=3218 RepID=A0A2K1L3L7_PHYPA|nr:uncharacterized protein LOC112278900 [Physcomitrium patens]PNR60616.1 hypothetical protein PHYPA_003409 [Physcomitrium patens]|eukprot:XP_024368558.1 uncharacterized protein LOC112278900 [Physcomitrella patens]
MVGEIMRSCSGKSQNPHELQIDRLVILRELGGRFGPSLRDPFSEIVFYLRTNPRVEKDGERCKQGTALAQSLFSASHRGQEKRRPCIDSSGIDGFTLARISVFTRLWL